MFNIRLTVIESLLLNHMASDTAEGSITADNQIRIEFTLNLRVRTVK